MSRRVQENLVAAILLLLFTAVLIMSFDYGPRARLVPVPIAIIGILLTLGQLVWQNLRGADELHVDVLELVAGREGSRRRKAGQAAAAQSEAAQREAAQDGAAQAEATRREAGAGQHSVAAQARAFGIVAALLALFLLLGPLPAIFLFSAGYFILSGAASWWRAIGYAFVCTALLYLTFGYTLQVQLNRGLAAPLIGQYVSF
jgi:Tripartite tricarboxylate transporter TctB family